MEEPRRTQVQAKGCRRLQNYSKIPRKQNWRAEAGGCSTNSRDSCSRFQHESQESGSAVTWLLIPQPSAPSNLREDTCMDMSLLLFLLTPARESLGFSVFCSLVLQGDSCLCHTCFTRKIYPFRRLRRPYIWDMVTLPSQTEFSLNNRFWYWYICLFVLLLRFWDRLSLYSG